MRYAALAFAAGIVVLQLQAAVPGVWVLAIPAGLGISLLAWRRRRLAVGLGAFLLGFAWAGFLAQQRLADELPAASEGRDMELVGVVAGLPQRFENGLRFDFDVETASLPAPSRISLAWYGRVEDEEVGGSVPALRAGERWRLTARLKRPHGNLNPHGFDYEAWLFERGIRATGYVRRAAGNARLDAFAGRPGYAVERLRQAIRDRFGRALGDAPHAGILVALAVGDQRAIAPDYWKTFARTGVTHLMSISGLHVTMVAGLAAWLAGWSWRRSPRLPLRLPAQKAAALAGCAAAFAYCLLAGFAVPAQRTLYMLGVVGLALVSGRTTAPSRVLALALLLVLFLDPWAVLAAGFWLSFGAVGLLFYIGSGRLGGQHWLAAWGRAQWAVTIGLIPALLALFQQFSLVSPLANAVAIPLVSLVVTPLTLTGTLPLADPLLWLAHFLVGLLMTLLDWLAASPWAVWQQPAPPAWTVVLGLAGVGWLLLPRGFPARWVGVLALVPLVATAPARPAPGEAEMTVLDVGHGLAVHVRTAGHDLLFDAGPAFSADANSGERIVLPYLRAVGARRLDGMVISHEDNDHAGGAEAVLAALPVDWLMTSLPAGHVLAVRPDGHRPCRAGESWTWDGVEFRILHPVAGDYLVPRRKSNDMSCVLKVTAGGRGLLLTADIEAKAEAALLARDRDILRADVLVVPHQGSGSSSTPDFVAAVGANTAIVPVGYRNRYGHPKAEVVERYRAAATDFRRTDLDGAVTVRLGAAGVAVTTERAARRRYWHGR